MSKLVNSISIPNIPFEQRPEGCNLPIWRSKLNPIIRRNINESIDKTFNSSVISYNGEFIGVFRGEQLNGVPMLFLGHSKDGYNFKLEKEPIRFVDEEGKPLPDSEWSYDPRLIPIEDKYYIVWCDAFYGATISIAYTEDFKKFVKIDTPFLPNNRNGVLFPRKINDKYYMLSRPSDIGHTPFGDIFLSESKDLEYWGHHRCVLQKGFNWWTSLKIGGGPAPIELDDGWLMFFHGVTKTCNGYVYSVGGVILDKNNPSKVLHKCDNYLLTPTEDYETNGFVDNVVFPTSVLVDGDTGRMAIYYGSADTYTCLAFTTVDIVVDYIKKHSVK